LVDDGATRATLRFASYDDLASWSAGLHGATCLYLGHDGPGPRGSGGPPTSARGLAQPHVRTGTRPHPRRETTLRRHELSESDAADAQREVGPAPSVEGRCPTLASSSPTAAVSAAVDRAHRSGSLRQPARRPDAVAEVVQAIHSGDLQSLEWALASGGVGVDGADEYGCSLLVRLNMQQTHTRHRHAIIQHAMGHIAERGGVMYPGPFCSYIQRGARRTACSSDRRGCQRATPPTEMGSCNKQPPSRML
jgi:hypothetical protein